LPSKVFFLIRVEPQHEGFTMFSPLFAYFGPETLMPVASIVGAVGGVIMIFGRSIFRMASGAMGVLLRKSHRVP
jgi:hypothetical protein